MANVAVNATISARDAASGNINKVNKSLKALQVGFAAVGVAAAGFARLAVDAVKAAAEDEMSNAKLNAALKVRGFLTDDLAAKINEQTLAMAAYGITDDQVRAGIEVGSRFFKDQATILKANAVAAQIAAATGSDLSSVMEILGKAAQGQTKGLKALGIETTKTVKKTIYKYKTDELGNKIRVKTTKLTKEAATIQDILSAASAKYGGIADGVANTTGGKFLSAQVSVNEQLEKFGYLLLPAVSTALDVFSTTVLPGAIGYFENFGKAVAIEIDTHIKPAFDELGRTIELLGVDFSGFFENLGSTENMLSGFSEINKKVDEFTLALKLMNEGIILFKRLTGQPIPGEGAIINPMDVKYAPDLRVPNPYGDTGTTVVTTVNIGTDKVDTVVANSIRRIGTEPTRQ
jgi:hypothetical protein